MQNSLYFGVELKLGGKRCTTKTRMSRYAAADTKRILHNNPNLITIRLNTLNIILKSNSNFLVNTPTLGTSNKLNKRTCNMKFAET